MKLIEHQPLEGSYIRPEQPKIETFNHSYSYRLKIADVNIIGQLIEKWLGLCFLFILAHQSLSV